MSDHTSTAQAIADEIGCSVGTVNKKAKDISVKIKGRSPEDHDRLLEALKDVKPRKRKAKHATKKATSKKTAKPTYASDVDAYFKQGKKFIKQIQKRLTEIEKEKAALEEKLNALSLLHQK